MLTEAEVKAAKPRQKPYRLSDGRGLYLQVMPSGSRLWRLRYFHAGRESMLGLGAYPDVGLKDARTRCEDARRQVAAKEDPAAAKRTERLAQADTFEMIAKEWLGKQKFEPKTQTKAEWTLDDLVCPFIGSKPIKALTPPMILDVLRRIEKRGKHDTAHRTRQRISQIFRYAIATGRAESDPTRDLAGALASIQVVHRPAIVEPAKVGALLRALDGYTGDASTVAALKLAPLVFVRPGELRGAEWAEFTLNGSEPEWRIPAARMKMKDQHIVPLSRQAVAILNELRQVNGNGHLVFPSLRSRERPISDNTLNAALRRMGFAQDEMTAHGFRAMASTLLNEKGYHPDLIERQLAHQERNKVRAAYNRAQRLAERRQMMQAWADYLDALRAAKSATAMHKATEANLMLGHGS